MENRAANKDKTENFSYRWQTMMKQMKLENIKKTAPNFFELSGGNKMKVKPYKDTDANSLTKAIIDFITYSGGTATRINTQGQMRKLGGVMKWTRGTTRKGTADIKAIYQGRSIDIEIKIGRDRLSEYQIREQERIERAGGKYFVAKSFPEFLKWWNGNILLNEQK